MHKINPGSISVFLFYTCPRSNVNLLSSLGIPHFHAVTETVAGRGWRTQEESEIKHKVKVEGRGGNHMNANSTSAKPVFTFRLRAFNVELSHLQITRRWAKKKWKGPLCKYSEKQENSVFLSYRIPPISPPSQKMSNIIYSVTAR